ncbi:MAG: DUF6340 family protein [Candidatus Cloacimonadota bacterium]|nr:DUF6340 family protein [Candidatus Cloacimonadota bacterium]
MKKKLKESLSLLLILIIAGCSGIVKYKIEHPPEICIGDVQNIKINKFSVSGNLNLNQKNNSEIVGEIVNFAKSTVTQQVGDKEIKNYYYSNMINKFANNGFYNIVENSENYGAEINGSIYYTVQDNYQVTKNKKKENDKNGKEIIVISKTYTLVRQTGVTINIRVADRNGNVIGASQVESNSSNQVTESTLNAARDNIECWESLVHDALYNTMTSLYRKVVPYYSYQHLKMKTGGSKKIKVANKKAQKGKWKAALKVWNSIEKSGNEKNRTAALYNIGIYNEVYDHLDKAIEIFKKLNLITNSSKYDKDIRRIVDRKEEEKKLEKEPKQHK